MELPPRQLFLPFGLLGSLIFLVGFGSSPGIYTRTFFHDPTNAQAVHN
jgi:hypothetical protein